MAKLTESTLVIGTGPADMGLRACARGPNRGRRSRVVEKTRRSPRRHWPSMSAAMPSKSLLHALRTVRGGRAPTPSPKGPSRVGAGTSILARDECNFNSRASTPNRPRRRVFS